MDAYYKLIIKYIKMGYSEEDAEIIASNELDIDIDKEN